MSPRDRSVPQHRYLLGWIVGITALAVLACAVPLGLTVRRLYVDEATADLDRLVSGLQTAPPAGGRGGLPVIGDASRIVGLYGPGGQRLLGEGPSSSAAAASAGDGHIHDTFEDGQLTATAPLVHPRGTMTVVRVGVPGTLIRHRTERAWAATALAALALLALAAVAARRIAGRAQRPVEQLAQALRRLDEAVARERAFSTDVAHQLRTPLTRLLLGLEAGLHRPDDDPHTAIRTAIGRGWALVDTVEELLRLARDEDDREPLDVVRVLERVRDRHEPDVRAAGRSLALTVRRPLPPVVASSAAVTQILDVLLDNALTHGAGTITVTAYHSDPALAVDVMDEGPGPRPGDDVFERRPATGSGEAHGLGLSIARSLAHAEGGRLYLSRTDPAVFTLLLPTSAPPPRPRTGSRSCAAS
ncbi:sensor histidine kinase [Actinomadura syzygii]|uniref:histidine kinase n=1 Tax=Actinomadura syzygii TaxID=1427538 RepID=A0A5D0UGA1_9ACTN|nr:HAMP domain-containing sensor histidine kinase [Actinomadura syzygii]TYC17531.1 HAMP domain-containing histidine kinase [Actinomadura syzygii]